MLEDLEQALEDPESFLHVTGLVRQPGLQYAVVGP